VLWEFEKIIGVKLEDIDTSTLLIGKQQRGELLVLLKESRFNV
jgi:hypothetical protein